MAYYCMAFSESDQPATSRPASVFSGEFKCPGCGSLLVFAPGTNSLGCPHCGMKREIAPRTGNPEEIDYARFIAEQYAQEKKMEVATFRCTGCGVALTLKPNVTADRCPYCGTNVVVQGGSTSVLLKPSALVPFRIDPESAQRYFREWIASRWFAPGDLKRRAASGAVDGIYLPYWTYDSNVETSYSGRRGMYYYETEPYTTIENGRNVTRMREVRHTRWTPVSGVVSNVFDDLLVPAARSLDQALLGSLNSWNTKNLVPFAEEYLSGFRAQSYDLDLKVGLVIAKQLMRPEIEAAIRRDIGGDEQEVLSLQSEYSAVTFKHILLPVWISSYQYGGKVYRFLVNGQTGEIRGDRPYSIAKIAFAVAAALIAVVILFVLLQR